MNRWKCTVCKFIMESGDEPKKCVNCDAESHKIKPKWKLLKKRFEFID